MTRQRADDDGNDDVDDDEKMFHYVCVLNIIFELMYLNLSK